MTSGDAAAQNFPSGNLAAASGSMVNGGPKKHRHHKRNNNYNSSADDDAGPGENEGMTGGGFFPGANMENLPNFHEVHFFLYRGGEPSPEGYSMLQHMGVRTVIDLRNADDAERDRQLLYERGMKLINLPMNPMEPPQPKLVNRFTEIINRARANPDNGVVFVHCDDGRIETGCMIGIYRVLSDNWSFAQAEEEMRKYGFKNRYAALRKSVQAYADSK